MKGLGCLGFVVLSLAFVLYLITSMTLNGTALNNGDKVNGTEGEVGEVGIACPPGSEKYGCGMVIDCEEAAAKHPEMRQCRDLPTTTIDGNRTLDLGTLEIRDDRLNETDELLDELAHAIESVEFDNST